MTNLNTPRVTRPGPLTEAELDAAVLARRAGLPRCSADACKQGRRPCPAPQACQAPDTGDDTDAENAGTGMVIGVAWALAVWALAAAVWLLWPAGAA
jgi:hypothetical protein